MPQNNSGSANRERIHFFLRGYAGGKYADSGVERDYESGKYLILLPPSERGATDRAVAMLENRLRRDLDIQANVKRLAGELNEVVSATLLKALAKHFDDSLADVVIATEGESCDVVVVVQAFEDLPDDLTRRRLHKRVAVVLEALELELTSLLYAILRDDAPSEYQLLRHVSVLAPVSSKDLQAKLLSDELHVPNRAWLNRQLDMLCRRKLLKFQRGLGFVVTENGLGYLPRQEHRNSPDIQRALALAKRRWIE